MSYAPRARSRDQDARLLVAYAAGRKPAQLSELVERYQPLSRSLASRYRGGRESFEDLFQVANLGLVKAIQGFEPERNVPFTAYAVPTILGELRRHFRDRVWNLRLPRPLQESAMRVEAATELLTERLGRSPTVDELAEETELPVDGVRDALVARDARWTVSFEAAVRDDDDDAGAPADLLGQVELGYDRVEADFACSHTVLEEREREVVALRFAAGLTQAEIGARLGISQMQVSRVSRRGLKKLLAAVQGDDAPGATTPRTDPPRRPASARTP